MTSVNKLAQGIANMIKRKNIMYFNATVREEPIKIRYASVFQCYCERRTY